MSPKVRRRRLALALLVLVPVGIWVAAKAGAFDSPQRTRTARATESALPSVSPSPSPLRSTAAPRAAFAPGTCASFVPSQGAPRGIVFLDAGHGGLDPGAAGRTSDGARIVEKTATLALVQATTERLRALGFHVVASRTADTTVAVQGAGDVENGALTPLGVRRDLLQRIACANAVHADVLVSLHMNAFSDPDEGGTMTIYDPDRPFSADNRRLAGLVQSSLTSAFRAQGWTIQDRSVRADTEIEGRALTAEGARYGHEILLGPRAANWVPNPSLMPGVIVEALFLTRPLEADIAATARGRAVIAGAIAEAVERFLAG